jgi:predicted O-linked N-acetylglucosamine transferase (SPINDLY family)
MNERRSDDFRNGHDNSRRSAPAFTNSGVKVERIMQEASAAYGRGRWGDAEQLCRVILSRDPARFDALSLLGVIAAQTRRLPEAADLLRCAVASQPRNAAAHNNYANILKELRRTPEALEGYERAIALDPNYAEAYHNRALVLQALGRIENACDSYRQATRLRRDYFEAHLNLAAALSSLGRLDEASDSARQAVRINPQHAGAHYNYGNILQAQGQKPEALASFRMALQLHPGLPEGHYSCGNLLYELGRHEEALSEYDRAISLRPAYADAHCNRGNVLGRLNRAQEALLCYERALELDPKHANAWFNRGNSLKAMGSLEAAEESYRRAVEINSRFADALFGLGTVCKDQARLDEALASFDQALRIRPDFAEAAFNRGLILKEQGRLNEALDAYDRAIALRPEFMDAHNSRGNVLQSLFRFDEAVTSYDRALQIDPASANAWNNRGNALQRLKRMPEALTSYDTALQLLPDYANAWNNRGLAMASLNRPTEALSHYERALWYAPDCVDAYVNRGHALKELRQFDAALKDYERALQLEPDHEWLYGNWLHSRMHLCDWRDWDEGIATLTARLGASRRATPPFPLLALTDTPEAHRRAAEIWVAHLHPENRRLGPLSPNKGSSRIRVGYFSADFRDHPVSLLMAGLLESHDRTQFEIIAFSFGPNLRDAARTRIERAVERFIDVESMSDEAIATLARQLDLDVAVDLGGFTDGSRAGVFALRVAPVQVSYLGYLGTLGAGYMDYIFADSWLIPPEQRENYAEKIAYLPNYQANSSARDDAMTLSRESLGLPATGFVYCCFNASYKITPPTFDSWMRILRHVPDSVLFLLSENPMVMGNLRREAQSRHVAPERLIFGDRVDFSHYLARLRAADLFLDTHPYNAGTTASDALWAGLPVLTCPGQSFAARMGSSILQGIGLPELIAQSREEFEQMAIDFAQNPDRLAQVRAKLATNRITGKMFDGRSAADAVEQAYLQMTARHRAGQPPDHIEA